MFCGVLNVYKEAGYTSNDVVAKLRGILHQKRIGHSGTLDPDATGVLPVLLGDATRLSGCLTGSGKCYRCGLLLGTVTDTQDISGKVLSKQEVSLDTEKIVSCIKSFEGGYMQTPPMYSAKKVNGQKLYELARRGITIERESVFVDIDSISVEKIELPYLTMTVECSKGTYIRTLCEDIGNKLGCGACMASLIRTRAGGLHIDDSIPLSGIEKLAASGSIAEKIIPVEEFFLDCLRVSTSHSADKKLMNGNTLTAQELDIFIKGGCYPKTLRVCDSRGVFAGIYTLCNPEGLYKSELMFLQSYHENSVSYGPGASK